VHFLGHVNVTRAAWPVMLEQGYGRVVNVTSGSVFGFAGSGPYACAKAAVLGLTNVLAAESRGTGILVNAIMPVAFTRMTAQIPDERFRGWLEAHTPASLVAPAACFLAHEACSTSGEIWSVGGGRVARVFLGQSVGYTSAELTVEDVRDHLDEIRATDGALVFTDSMDEVRHYMQVLRDPVP
jgi:NAD(P)-dependent dehydrogenase (short-subunit alcohol dehydrogenase family)